MKSRITTIVILMLAFFLKDAITLVVATGEMASAEMSASVSLAMLPLANLGDTEEIGPIATPALASAVPDASVSPSSVLTADGSNLSAAPPACHAAPFTDSQTPLPQLGESLQRVTTLGATGASGLDAILLGSAFLGLSSALTRRRAFWRRLVGFVPALTIPPG
jgi:hypothetical protein